MIVHVVNANEQEFNAARLWPLAYGHKLSLYKVTASHRTHPLHPLTFKHGQTKSPDDMKKVTP